MSDDLLHSSIVGQKTIIKRFFLVFSILNQKINIIHKRKSEVYFLEINFTFEKNYFFNNVNSYINSYGVVDSIPISGWILSTFEVVKLGSAALSSTTSKVVWTVSFLVIFIFDSSGC